MNSCRPVSVSFFFFNDTATTEIYTLSLHDALPICGRVLGIEQHPVVARAADHLADKGGGNGGPQSDLRAGFAQRALERIGGQHAPRDPKSTRLNSRHLSISYGGLFLVTQKITYDMH